MDEFALIKRYFQTPFQHSLDATGGSDDAAVLELPANSRQVISVDTMVEGRHFYPDMAPDDIAYRALAVAVSDLAAMGAKPWWFTLALSLPDVNEAWLQGFSRGLKTLADALPIRLIGGDTTRGPLSISVQVAGLLPLDQGLYRRGAQLGDIVAVTGYLGDAAGGLAQWRQADADPYLRQRYCRPTPQLGNGQQLLALASSCVDISDGLLADAGHIAARSGVALQLDYACLPISRALEAAVGLRQARLLAATGGDDYELCFTIAPSKLPALAATAMPYHRIGTVKAGAGVQLCTNDGALVPITSHGYNHFHD